MSIFKSISDIKLGIRYDELKFSSAQAIQKLNSYNDDFYGPMIDADGRGSVEVGSRKDYNYENLTSNQLAEEAASFRI